MHNDNSKMGTNGDMRGLVHHRSCTARCPSDCSGEWEHTTPEIVHRLDPVDIKVVCGMIFL